MRICDRDWVHKNGFRFAHAKLDHEECDGLLRPISTFEFQAAAESRQRIDAFSMDAFSLCVTSQGSISCANSVVKTKDVVPALDFQRSDGHL